ncbi:MAG: RNA methyltransferase [Pseudobutyrivibrio sp.]|nr:RNA methyltransferase [Pseudobutyrivibrio sp.]
MQKITDFNDSALDIYARYNEAQLLHYYEPNGGLFIAETPMVIERALDRGCEPVSFLIEEKAVDTNAAELIKRCGDIPVYTGSLQVLNQLTGFNLTRGVLCAMRRPKPIEFRDLLESGIKRIAVLEEVMNPTNVGAIFRSAAALGMEAVVLTSGSSDPFYRRAARVSMGTVFQIPWCMVDMELDWMGQLKKYGFTTAAMALKDNCVDIDNAGIKSSEKLAIILGTEATGLTDRTIDASDYVVKIPMSAGVDSLNVAAASAVAFWAINH